MWILFDESDFLSGNKNPLLLEDISDSAPWPATGKPSKTELVPLCRTPGSPASRAMEIFAADILEISDMRIFCYMALC